MCWEPTTEEKQDVGSQRQQKSEMLRVNDSRKAKCWEPTTEEKRGVGSQRQKKKRDIRSQREKKNEMLGAKRQQKSMMIFAYSCCTMGTKRKGMEAAVITELAEEGWQWFQRQQKKRDSLCLFLFLWPLLADLRYRNPMALISDSAASLCGSRKT